MQVCFLYYPACILTPKFIKVMKGENYDDKYPTIRNHKGEYPSRLFNEFKMGIVVDY